MKSALDREFYEDILIYLGIITPFMNLGLLILLWLK